MNFARIAVVDWSAASAPKRGRDSIWIAEAKVGADTVKLSNPATRAEALERLEALARAALGAGERLLIGADFAFGFPAGLDRVLTGRDDAMAVWGWLAEAITDDARNATNLRAVAARMNAAFPGEGPFWGNGAREAVPGLPRKKPALPPGLAEHRAAEIAGRSGKARPKSPWQLAGAGAVGAQSLTGIAALARLRSGLPAHQVAVWPFEPVADAPIVLAEVYPSLLSAEIEAARRPDEPLDAAQVRCLALALARLSAGGGIGALFEMPPEPAARREGWILGTGHLAELRAALGQPLEPPRLRNDCFAMPQGVAWVPVDEALGRLRTALSPVTGTEIVATASAAGRVLAEPVAARRSNPPAPNAAVDGYGFAHAATGSGVQRLPLVAGRAAAGQPFRGTVAPGHAIRILTGAILPQGVDTVVLEEDCATDGTTLAFDGPVKRGANTRRAGEDVEAGAIAFEAGQQLRAPDLALLSALGIAELRVRRRLRVGVLSTGDEVVAGPAASAAPHQIYDANRPMLLALAARWGHEAIDLGHVRDNPRAIAARLDAGARKADLILTSGGASAGDEDHVSRLLRERGQLSSWRIAIKPGRPLALALWNGIPVMGLPGNPVAAFVCALIFGRPALSLLSGAGWTAPQGFTVPAAFSKSKKPGRREYLRARLDAEGRAEVFASEGSGRISGLAWATGLVELPDGPARIEPGTPVRFLPYASFGL